MSNERLHRLLQTLEKDGLDWAQLNAYFPYTDRAWSEGEYERLLTACCRAINDPPAFEQLLGLLNLQYTCLLEQFALQARFLEENRMEEIRLAERVAAYLQINSGMRWAEGLDLRPNSHDTQGD